MEADRCQTDKDDQTEPVVEAAATTDGVVVEKSVDEEPVPLTIIYKKDKFNVSVLLSGSVDQLKAKVEELTGIPPNMQKLTGRTLLRDGCTLSDCKVTSGSKLMLIGNKPDQIAEVSTHPKLIDFKSENNGCCLMMADVLSAETLLKQNFLSTCQNPMVSQKGEEKVIPTQPLCQQKMHKKILEKGKPDDAMLGIRNVKDPLPLQPISGMVNKLGNKVRLTFKLELDQVWIGTKERTDKVMMNQIRNVISEPIEGHEEYCIMGLQLGTTEASNYWLYWVPAQYVDAIRQAILGP